MNLNFLLLTIILVVKSITVFSQGSWTIKYLPIASMDDSIIGKEIRLDFKSNTRDTLNEAVNVFSIRKLLSTRDTVKLNINGIICDFVENWNFYVDHGSLRDQTLESINDKAISDHVSIKEMFLTSVDDSSLKVKIYLHTGVSKGERYKTLSIIVKKSKLKGFLISL